MWILHFLPDAFITWVANAVLLAGVILTVLGLFVHRVSVPLLYQYQLLFKVLGIVVLCAGVYLRGGVAVEQAWRERVAEVETRLKQAEEISQSENTRIEAQVVTRTRVVRERAQEIVKYVDREIIKYDTKFAPGGVCEIPQEFITAHNRAAEVPTK